MAAAVRWIISIVVVVHVSILITMSTGISCRELNPDRSPIGDYNCDAPWSLVQNAFDAMKQIEPNADFVIWTGDSILHTLQVKKEAVLSSSFNEATMVNLTNMLKATFGDIPVYPVFGNNDYYPNGQFPATPDPMYQHMLPHWYSWVRDANFNATFSKGGYYAINLSRHLKLISLNTILNYIRNKNVTDMPDPADQISWFESQLEEARITGRKVYVIAHVAMGVVNDREYLWLYDVHHAHYLHLMERYKDVLAAMFFGHDHVTLFKVFRDSLGVPRVPLFITASVTPWIWDFPHNPAFALMTYEQETGRILEMSQYYVDLPKATRAGFLRWEKLYDFSTLYNTTDLSARSLSSLGDRFQNNDLMRKFLRLSLVNATEFEPCDQDCLDKFRCGILHLDMARFERCMDADTPCIDSDRNRGSGKIGAKIGFTAGALLVIAAIGINLYTCL